MSGFDSSRRQSATRRFLAPGQLRDRRLPWRQAERVGGDLHLHLGVRARSRDDRLELRLLGGELVEVGIGLCVRRVDLVEPCLRVEDFREPSSTASRTVFAASSSGSCGRKPIRMLGMGTASPSNSLSSPAMMRSRLDLPEPLSPSTPILAPGKNDSDMSFRMTRLGGRSCPRDSSCTRIEPW
jgi:hypothetical protein